MTLAAALQMTPPTDPTAGANAPAVSASGNQPAAAARAVGDRSALAAPALRASPVESVAGGGEGQEDAHHPDGSEQKRDEEAEHRLLIGGAGQDRSGVVGIERNALARKEAPWIGIFAVPVIQLGILIFAAAGRKRRWRRAVGLTLMIGGLWSLVYIFWALHHG